MRLGMVKMGLVQSCGSPTLERQLSLAHALETIAIVRRENSIFLIVVEVDY
jgi:hypothetical protein